jgi:acyl-CoA synthetase (AMP-forming)/AMP-acid ligase II
MNIVMLLEMAADAFPDRLAVTCGGASLDYATLLRAARAGAVAIREGGFGHVAHLAVASPAAPVAMFAAAVAQAPYVPLNYRLTPDELSALVARIDPCLLVADGVYASRLALPPNVLVQDREAFLAAALDGAPAELESLDQAIAVQLFTSGTTGQPKAAILRHENLVSYIVGSVEFASAGEDEATLVSAPPYHIAAIAAMLSSVYAGRRIVQLPNFDAADWLRLCRDEKVSSAFVVPTMLSRIVEQLDASGAAVADLPALRSIAYGGGRMPLPVIGRAMALFPGVDFTNAYGLTETSSTICLLDPDDHRAAASSADPSIRRRLASVGRGLPSVELAVLDADGAPVGVEEVGRVHVRGPQVAGEYGGLGSLLNAEGWFDTRDRGFLDAEGYLFLDGRADDVIVRGGENISPGEVEDVLLAHPAVADVAVIGVPDDAWGEAVAAAIVLRRQVEPGELQAWVQERLRSSRVPQQVRFVSELPYNELGKLLRRVVRADFVDGAGG